MYVMYYVKLNTLSLVLRETVNFVHWDLRGTKYELFPEGPVLKWFVIYSWKFWSWKFIKPGNRALLAFWCHRFCNAACSQILAGNSFIVRCYVTSNNQWKGEKISCKIICTMYYVFFDHTISTIKLPMKTKTFGKY